ncbi:membrane-bound O-acyltransferase domain-containing protein 2-like isoform X2 [Pomacea canaliculata]|uniref:membrane-bound O-acyltransferase domain-containing protein 2-like isoform X2 n=1 Tax=Pomacea canaliculata TaxID=400727 RepID=UPI000D73D08D|nr:membrane-bound O-acyltransferase domain-containing protein 2-like isoform X2 [Pomacea canaliculata]
MTVGREYDGILWLQGIASLLGLPVSQVRQTLWLPSFCAYCWHQCPESGFQIQLHPSITVMLFSDGFLLVAETLFCYVIILVCPAQMIHIGLFVYGMGCLILGHVYMIIFPFRIRCYDFTFSLLIITQKITSLGFNLVDGHRHNNNNIKLSDQRLQLAVRKKPGLLELSSYLLGFQGVIAGPFCFYKEYIDFFEGRHYRQKSASENDDPDYQCRHHIPSPSKAVLQKVLASFFWTVVYVVLQTLFPLESHLDPAFVARHNIFYRMLHAYLSLLGERAKYYVGWTLAEAVNNAAGFGFAGFDQNGKPRWDLLTNLHIKHVEMATSFKTYIDNWNLRTVVWLRFVCYDRAPWNPTLLTFTLSAVWHGLWPGYYFMFLSSAVFTVAARKVRRNIRPYFQKSKLKQIVYDVITLLATQATITYIVFSFVFLHLDPIIFFYSQWYWAIHIFAVLIILVLPKGTSSHIKISPAPEHGTDSDPMLDSNKVKTS